jgi:hypothetical protein
MPKGAANRTPDDGPLLRSLHHLHPYLSDIVLIGGWVPYIYQRYGGFDEWRSHPGLTEEADVLLSTAPGAGAREPLAAMLRRVGFEPMGSMQPPAVWRGRGPPHDRIEFLVHHEGTARQIGRPRVVPGQPGLGAISLPGLQLLATHTQVVPVGNNPAEIVQIRVPTLGAFVVQKAVSCVDRADDAKAGKDIIYLRDIMGAGSTVRDRVARDIQALRGDPSARSALSRARDTIGKLEQGWPRAPFSAAVRELSERENIADSEVAAADVAGHLGLLTRALRSRRPHRGDAS